MGGVGMIMTASPPTITRAVSSKLNAVQQDIALLNARAAQLGAIWGVTASVIASLAVWLIQRLFEK